MAPRRGRGRRRPWKWTALFCALLVAAAVLGFRALSNRSARAPVIQILARPNAAIVSSRRLGGVVAHAIPVQLPLYESGPDEPGILKVLAKALLLQDGRTLLRGALFFNAMRPTRLSAAYNPGAVAGLHLNLVVSNCTDCNRFRAPRRRVALHVSPCAGGIDDWDAATHTASCAELADPKRANISQVGVVEFRADLGWMGQELDLPPSFEIALEIGETSGSVSLTSIVANPEVADVGAVDEDLGERADVASGRAWRDAVLDVLFERGENVTAAPALPDETADPTYSSLGAAAARYAPPRLAPGIAPTKRVVQVWSTLPEGLDSRPKLLAVLVEHFLRSGGTAVVAYVSPEAAAPLSAHPALRALVSRGVFLLVRWEDVERPLGRDDYDKLFLNAHALLSLWGRNALVFLSDADEVLALPSAEAPAEESPAAVAVEEVLAEARRRFPVAPLNASAVLRLDPCPAHAGGFWATAGASTLRSLRRRRHPTCAPSEGLPKATPRQQRLARMLSDGGCAHRQLRDALRRRGPVHEALVQAPRCAQVGGHQVFLLGDSQDSPSGMDGFRIESAGSLADAFAYPWREQPTFRRRKPFFDPDAVLPPDVHYAVECLGRRTQPWGSPPPGGHGPQVELQRRADGRWDLSSTGVPQSASTDAEVAPTIESACRIVSTCSDAPAECIQLRRLVNLNGVTSRTRDFAARGEWRAVDDDWLWVWSRDKTAEKGD